MNDLQGSLPNYQSKSVLDKRRAGILLPVTALPSSSINSSIINNCNGDFSQTFQFIDFLSDSGFSVWQVLPLGPTHPEKSPYQCLSAHAGNPLLISLDWLYKLGYLSTSMETIINNDDGKYIYLEKAFFNFKKKISCEKELHKEYQAFTEQQAYWLEDYALFTVIRESRKNLHWIHWEVSLRDRWSNAIGTIRLQFNEKIEKVKFEQFVFFQQWQEIKNYAHQKNILLFGDIPLFVAHDSANVWAHREVFLLDKTGQPKIVTGVPPDYFSSQGQRWGNPHYDWNYLESQQFKWWIQRIHTELERYDLLRIDHFRGLAASWAIPAEAETAESGYWLDVPGAKLLQTLENNFKQLPFIAEDLGIITPDVEHLRDQFHLPGMKVLQFAFDNGSDNPYLPKQHIEDCILYTGTHDNNTSLGWYLSLSEGMRDKVNYFLENYKPSDFLSANDSNVFFQNKRKEMPWPLIDCALSSIAKIVVIPMQDLLSLDSKSRTNIPGTLENNWRWRFDWSQIGPDLAPYLKKLVQSYRRH